MVSDEDWNHETPKVSSLQYLTNIRVVIVREWLKVGAHPSMLYSYSIELYSNGYEFE